MKLWTLVVSAAVCAVLVVLGMWIFDISLESALVLAPVFVLSVGGIAFLVILWAKVIYESVRGSRSGNTASNRSTSSNSL